MSFTNFLRLAALALVVLQASPARAADPVIIDWSKGDMQETAASCGTFTLKHLADHHSYTLLVRGTVAGTCAFEAKGLKFRLPSNFGASTPGGMSLFNFERFGSDVVITWIAGY